MKTPSRRQRGLHDGKRKRIYAMLFGNNSGGGVNALLDGAPFLAELTHSLVLSRGTGSPTFTRATTGTVSDNEGVLRTAIAGEARFVGARRVYNLAGNSEDITSAAWSNYTVAPASISVSTSDVPDGAAQATSITAAGAFSGRRRATTLTIGRVYLATFSAKGAVGGEQVWFSDDHGTGGFPSVTTEWADYSILFTCAQANMALGIKTAGATVKFSKLQMLDMTGETDTTTLREYVSVGVLSAPYHGAGVDGVKYFNTDLTGAAIPAATNLGYLAEAAATQLLPTADIRDMTTAGWTLGATMTRARTSVGADGAANSATRLTGGAVAATNTCYTTIVAAASSRTYSALVKRVTGTGPVRIVQTGTETDISSLINSSTYTLVQLNASILNAVMGFKIDTNGDAIDVDFNQFEAGTAATSRMVTTGVTRNADVLTYPSAGNIDETVGWCYAEASFNDVARLSGLAANVVGTTTAGRLIEVNSSTSIRCIDAAVNLAAKTLATPLSSTPAKLASSWGADGMKITGRGETPATQATFTSMTLTGGIGIMCRNDGTTQPNGTIRNVRIGQRQLSASEMQAITAP